jgi:alginate O-acetyltransferase complex protein AlgI
MGGLLQLLVLCASVQVPGKLGWRDDFRNLRPLNRKVFWTYGAYIFSIIAFMAIASFVLAKQPASVAGSLWAVFIATFWAARVVIDFLYMNHEDWPSGPLFTIGHICLSTLFLSLAAIYTSEVFLLSKEIRP